MKRPPVFLTVAFLLLTAAPLWADPPTVTVPKTVSAQVGAPVFITATVTNTKSAAFLCLDDGLELLPSAKLVSKLEAVAFGTRQGAYKVIAVAANADGLAVGVTVVTVGDSPPNPPLPGNGFTPTLAAAWQKETAPTRAADARQLAAVFDVASKAGKGGAYDPGLTTAGDLLAAMHAATQALIADRLPAVRAAVAGELAAHLPSAATAPLDNTTRAACAAQFRRMSLLLGGLK